MRILWDLIASGPQWNRLGAIAISGLLLSAVWSAFASDFRMLSCCAVICNAGDSRTLESSRTIDVEALSGLQEQLFDVFFDPQRQRDVVGKKLRRSDDDGQIFGVLNPNNETRKRRTERLLALKFSAPQDADSVATQKQLNRPIKIVEPLRLSLDDLSAVRTPFGEPNDYKPWIVRLKNGELLLVAFCFGGISRDQLPKGALFFERAVFWRSRDDGQTWSSREERMDLHGREFAITSLSDGTLIMPCQLLRDDSSNQAGHSYSKIFRSVDGGHVWTETRIGPEGFPEKAQTAVDWNAIEFPDADHPGKTIVQLGVSMQFGGHAAADHVYLWRSRDSGATWDKSFNPETDRWSDVDGFCSQTTTYRTASGSLFHPVRVDATGPHWELPAIAGFERRSGDQDDRTMLWKSTDNGRSFHKHKDGGRFGTYGEMYPRFLRLQDQRLLLTFTVRSNSTDGSPLGLRGLISTDDGETWDFQHDRIVLSDRNHGTSGGGFGNTIQCADQSLISCYSYRGEDRKTHIETVRWNLPATRE